ncbi:hypothetical protein TanjilG_01781 [Lupinus angustifolius]|uniref:Uncharacterized protein n=1 Tax=Lupinus angustifolius TaxID=3871 RepID=A0A1J7HIA2_LUPAN|nr:hypothetical protein TanjilG_01781 [Lupinus angustifolius]
MTVGMASNTFKTAMVITDVVILSNSAIKSLFFPLSDRAIIQAWAERRNSLQHTSFHRSTSSARWCSPFAKNTSTITADGSTQEVLYKQFSHIRNQIEVCHSCSRSLSTDICTECVHIMTLEKE